jgi:HrpA-like RNA helicase
MRALDPPRSDSIVKAIYLLGELRALNEDGTLSPIGEHMVGARLNVMLENNDLRISQEYL